MGDILSRIMPARQKPAVKVIADLDSIVSQPIGFRFMGKDYVIEPVTTEKFMQIAGALERMQNIAKEHAENKGITQEDVYESYHDFIKSLCPKITVKDLRSMALPQLHAVINLMIRHITGQTDDQMVGESEIHSEKKKTLA